MAARVALPLPLVAAALAEYRAASEAGLGREDDAAITKHIAARAGLRLPGDA
jgi:3-hydroxyisobutyrate dehydrogenase/2-hydroxy-3-oxopropionate reductase